MESDQIRDQQIAHARTLQVREGYAPPRRDTGAPRSSGKRFDKPRAPRKPSGHDAILAELQSAKAQVMFTLTSGDITHGIIVARDKFTITVNQQRPQNADPTAPAAWNSTFYKHAIESFSVPVTALSPEQPQ
jgi:sRNA-binding regulator protein Hfq